MSLFSGPRFSEVEERGPLRVGDNGSLMNQANGTYEITMAPRTPDEFGDPLIGRMSIDKRFLGDLDGTSKGEMLGARTATPGSAGYVAIEKVTGSLHGRGGTFVFQHTGTMTRGSLRLSVTVVPDSGTGELAGLAGSLKIVNADGKHSYEFEYTLSEPHEQRT